MRETRNTICDRAISETQATGAGLMTTATEECTCWHGTLTEIEDAVEALLAAQLLHERMRTVPNEVDRESEVEALDSFEDWADSHGLPTTPHVLAAFMIELHRVYDVGIDVLKFLAAAYLRQNDRDVRVPITAALNFCSQ